MEEKYVLHSKVPGGSDGNKISNDNQWQPKDLKGKTDSNLQKEQNVLLEVFGFICNMAIGLFWS